MSKKKRIAVSELNPHLLCILCGGYYVDATTVIECLHTFCKSCIVRYLETSKFCPTCDVLVHKTKPLLSIRPDKSLQNAVYKLVPGLLKNEMCRRKKFYADTTNGKPTSEEDGGNHMNSEYLLPNDSVSIALKPMPPLSEDQTCSNFLHTRFFNCPAGVSVALLKKLLRAKFDLPENHPVLISASKNDLLDDEFTLIDVAYIKSWKKECPLNLYYKIYFTKRLKVDPELEKSIYLNNDAALCEERCMPKLEPELEVPCISESEERTLPKLSPIIDLVPSTSTDLVTEDPPCITSTPPLAAEGPIVKTEAIPACIAKASPPSAPTTYKAIIPAPLRPTPVPEMVSLSSITIPNVDPLTARNCSPGAYGYGFGLLTPPGGNVPSLFSNSVVDTTKISGAILPFGLTLAPSLIYASPTPVNNLNVTFSDSSNISNLATLTLHSLWGHTETNPNNIILPLANLETSVVHSMPTEPISSIIKSEAPQVVPPDNLPLKGSKKPKLIRPKKNTSDKCLPPLLPPPQLAMALPPVVEEKEVQLMISESGIMIVNEGDKSSNHLEGLISPEATELLTKIESGSLLSLSDPYFEDSKESDTSDGAEKLAQIKQEITSILSTLSSDEPQNSVVVSQVELASGPVIVQPSPVIQQLATSDRPPLSASQGASEVVHSKENEVTKLSSSQTSTKESVCGDETSSVSNSIKDVPSNEEDPKIEKDSRQPPFILKSQPLIKTKAKGLSEKSDLKKKVASTLSTSNKMLNSDKVINQAERKQQLPPPSPLPHLTTKDHTVKRLGRRHSQPIGYKTLKISPRGWNPTIPRDKLQKKLESSTPKTNKFFKARNSIVNLTSSSVNSTNVCTNVKQSESLLSGVKSSLHTLPLITSISKEPGKPTNHILNKDESQHVNKENAENLKKCAANTEANTEKANLEQPASESNSQLDKQEIESQKNPVNEEPCKEKSSKPFHQLNNGLENKEKDDGLFLSSNEKELEVSFHTKSAKLISELKTNKISTFNKVSKQKNAEEQPNNKKDYSTLEVAEKYTKELEDKVEANKKTTNTTKNSSTSSIVKDQKDNTSLSVVAISLPLSDSHPSTAPFMSQSLTFTAPKNVSTSTSESLNQISRQSSPKENPITFPSRIASGTPLTSFAPEEVPSSLTVPVSLAVIPKPHSSAISKNIVSSYASLTSTKLNSCPNMSASKISNKSENTELHKHNENVVIQNSTTVAKSIAVCSSEMGKPTLSTQISNKDKLSSDKDETQSTSKFDVAKVLNASNSLKNANVSNKKLDSNSSMNALKDLKQPKNLHLAKDSLKDNDVSKAENKSTNDANNFHCQLSNKDDNEINKQNGPTDKNNRTEVAKGKVLKEASDSKNISNQKSKLKSQMNIPKSQDAEFITTSSPLPSSKLAPVTVTSSSLTAVIDSNSNNGLLPPSKSKPQVTSAEQQTSSPFNKMNTKLKQNSSSSISSNNNNINGNNKNVMLTEDKKTNVAISATLDLAKQPLSSIITPRNDILSSTDPSAIINSIDKKVESLRTLETFKNAPKAIQNKSTSTNLDQNVLTPNLITTTKNNVERETKLSSNENISPNKRIPADVQLHYTIANALNSVFSSQSSSTSSFALESEALSFAEKNPYSLSTIASLNTLIGLQPSDTSCPIVSTLPSTTIHFESSQPITSLPYSNIGAATSNFSSDSSAQPKVITTTSKTPLSCSHHNASVSASNIGSQQSMFHSISTNVISSSSQEGISVTSSQNQNLPTSATMCHTQPSPALQYHGIFNHSSAHSSINSTDSHSKSGSLSEGTFPIPAAQHSQTIINTTINSKPSEVVASSQSFEVPQESQPIATHNSRLENNNSFMQQHNNNSNNNNNLGSFSCGEGFYFGNSLQNNSMPFVNNFMGFTSTPLTHANIPTTAFVNSTPMNNAAVCNIHHQPQNKLKSHTSDTCTARSAPSVSSATSATADCSQSFSSSFSSLAGVTNLQDASKFIQNLLSPSSHASQEPQKSNLKSPVEELDKLILQTISSTGPESKIVDLFPSQLVDCNDNTKIEKPTKSTLVSTSLETPTKYNSQLTTSASSLVKVTSSSNSSQIMGNASQITSTTASKQDNATRLNSTVQNSHSTTTENIFHNMISGSPQFQTTATISNNLSKCSAHLPIMSLQSGSSTTSTSNGSQNAHFKSAYHHQTQCCKHQIESSGTLMNVTKDQNNQPSHQQQIKLTEQHVNTSSIAKKSNELGEKTDISTSTSTSVYGSYSENSNYNSVSSTNNIDSNMAKKAQRSSGYLGSNSATQSPHQFSSLSLNSMMNNFHDGVPSSNLSTPHKHATQGSMWDNNPLNPFIFNNNADAYGSTVNKTGFSSNASSNCIQQNLFRNSNAMNAKGSTINTHSQMNFNATANVSCSLKNSSTANTQYGLESNNKKGGSNVDSYDHFSVGSQKYNASLYYSNYNNNYANFFSNSQSQGSPSLTSLVSGTGYNFPLSSSKFTSCQQYLNLGQNSANNSYFSSGNFNVNCGSNYQSCINQPPTSNVAGTNVSSNFGNNFSGPLCNISLPYYSNCSFSYNSYPYFYQGGDMSLLSPTASFMPPFSCLSPRPSLSSRNSSSSQSFNDFPLQSGFFSMMPFVSPLQGNGARATPSPVGAGITPSFSGRPFATNYSQKTGESGPKAPHKIPQQASPKGGNAGGVASSGKSKHRKTSTGNKHKPSASKDAETKALTSVGTNPINTPLFYQSSNSSSSSSIANRSQIHPECSSSASLSGSAVAPVQTSENRTSTVQLAGKTKTKEALVS